MRFAFLRRPIPGPNSVTHAVELGLAGTGKGSRICLQEKKKIKKEYASILG
jgi:hypothetical protein